VHIARGAVWPGTGSGRQHTQHTASCMQQHTAAPLLPPPPAHLRVVERLRVLPLALALALLLRLPHRLCSLQASDGHLGTAAQGGSGRIREDQGGSGRMAVGGTGAARTRRCGGSGESTAEAGRQRSADLGAAAPTHQGTCTNPPGAAPHPATCPPSCASPMPTPTSSPQLLPPAPSTPAPLRSDPQHHPPQS
jgi:hypothetical protein